jgi:hypothetical protein
MDDQIGAFNHDHFVCGWDFLADDEFGGQNEDKFILRCFTNVSAVGEGVP